MWTDPFSAMANSNGLAQVNKDRERESAFISPYWLILVQSTWFDGQVCMRRSGFHPDKLTGPVRVVHCILLVFYFTCVVHIAMHVFTFVSFCYLRLCYVQSCTF